MSLHIDNDSYVDDFPWKQCIHLPTKQRFCEMNHDFNVETPHGTLIGRCETDYLMKGDDGTLYIMKKSTFKRIMKVEVDSNNS